MADRVIRQDSYNWETETDAMDWLTAGDRRETMKHRLHELQGAEGH